MTRVEHHGFDPLRFLNAARTKNWLDDLAHVHHRNELVVSATDQRKVCEKPNTVDPKFAGSSLGTDNAVFTPERDGPVYSCVIRELVELRDVRERHVGTVSLPNDCPIASPRD